MNLIQTFRRLGQQMSGWNEAMDMQDAQMSLIKKMYAINGFELKNTSPACPEQYEIFKDGKQVAYYRLRHGEFRVDFPSCGGETIYYVEPKGDGIFDDDERIGYLLKAMRALLLKLKG